MSNRSRAMVGHERAIQPVKPSLSAPPRRSSSIPKMGNQAAQRLLRDGVIQAKLTVNQRGDKFEQEADRVADTVMRMPDLSAGTLPPIQRMCSDCEEQLQRNATSSSAAGVGGTLESRIAGLQGGDGQPLSESARAHFEPRFGEDFSKVRIHTSSRAAETAKALNALAYTRGRNIVFAPGQYQPDTPSGKKLLAHELAHVVQQGARTVGSVAVQRAPVSASATPAVPMQPAVNKIAAQSALLDWQKKAYAFLDGTRAWLAANWTAYLGMTSSNPSLGWQESFIYGVASNAFGNALSDAAKAAFKRLLTKGAVKAGAAATGTAVGAAVGNVPGAVIGFIAGVLIESVASLIFDAIFGKKELDEVAAKASRTTAQLIEAKTSGFEKEAQGAKSRLHIEYSIKQWGLTSTSSQAEADALQSWAEEEAKLIKDPPRLEDRSLYAAMIRDWILEHAGDEEDPSKATSAAQWRFAVKAAKAPKALAEERQKFGLPALPQALEAGEDLDNHPEIFAYQTRRHWGDYGLPLHDEAQKMVEKVPDLLAQSPQHPAAAVKAFFDGKSFTVTRTRQPHLIIRMVNQEDTDFVIVEEQMQNIERNQFTLTCKLDLDEADGSVYVNKWQYTLSFEGELPNYTCVATPRGPGGRLCGRPLRKTEFAVSPD